jgi:hypothetical protein
MIKTQNFFPWNLSYWNQIKKTGGIGNAQNETIVSIAQNAGGKFYTQRSRQCQENIPYSK